MIEVTRRLVDGFHRYDVEVEVEVQSFRGEARDAFAAFDVSSEAVVAVAEQRAAHEAWMESFG